MCGIFAYTGTKRAIPLLIEGLRTLEYRGYDSAGFYVASGISEHAVGPVVKLKEKVPNKESSTAGIAHTRWATHGAPTFENTHPHSDCKKEIWLVHNGIIENHKELRDSLTTEGHIFSSETDTEVLTHLIEKQHKNGSTIEKAVTKALRVVRGTYGIAVMHKKEPQKIIVARMGSPIVIGVGNGEYFVSSDPSALLAHTKRVLYLNDGEFAVLTPEGHNIYALNHKKQDRGLEEIEWDVEHVQKGGFEHFMLKEIMEAPQVLHNSARGRTLTDRSGAKLGGLESVQDKLKKTSRIMIVGCGSAYYAGLAGKYMLEEYTNIPVEVEIASEFRYRTINLEKNSVVLAISQSGETADTLACIREAKKQGLLTLGIVNVVGSTIARETDAGVYNHAGPEIGVASTKAFISQIEVLVLFMLFLGRQRTLSERASRRIVRELSLLPDKVQKILDQREQFKKTALKYSSYNNALYIGRKYNYPIAYEGALKLKEVSYIHAEGYGSGEMKHGPIAMIDEQFPTIALVPQDSVYEKTLSNMEEIRARRGPILAIATEGDTRVMKCASDTFYVPKTLEVLSPILMVIPLQLLAYYIGVARGYNVDRPRNLAKSVTVE